ncbi:unnamed protein product [Ranitomeya imitator]|uniref:Uncharacterized protein n=1 Tax=Ranitomeya imitator TaxID=111125 RepID=A0ABN9MDF2_9NEOB|nr:unnamed protein product [Ranitomeya imitator]
MAAPTDERDDSADRALLVRHYATNVRIGTSFNAPHDPVCLGSCCLALAAPAPDSVTRQLQTSGAGSVKPPPSLQEIRVHLGSGSGTSREGVRYTGKQRCCASRDGGAVQLYLDNMYSMLNIRVVLVGLEIWTTMNYINIDGSAGEVLGRFVQWRETQLLPRRRHDSAQLVLKKKFGGTAGMAFVGTVCSRSHAGGINVFSTQTLQSFSSIVAHELGHNLGMNHDNDRGCKCSTQYCIMNSGASDSKNFSSCSEDDFEKLILNKGGTCLLNVPRPDESYTAPFCGNRLVDPGEECDCGNEKECEKDPCCQPGKCKLRSGAECANGACCQNCRFSPGGTVCRAVTNECDLPEYCNGSSPFCQPDVFIQNGNPCQNTKAYCYNGVCQYYDAQCQRIFGPNAKSAAPICFQNVNSKGDRFGNCGYQGSAYKSCESRNAMCGKLQCENVNSMPIFGIAPSIIQTPVQDIICWGVDFQLGSDVPDPAMVNEGTKCAEGKVCKGFQCVDSAALGYDCDVQNKCGGNGVCNSNKKLPL